MSNRLRNRIPSLNGKHVDSKPASDATKLAWKEIMGPLQTAANALNIVINETTDRVVRESARRDGVDLNTHALNLDSMEWVPRPNPEVARDAPAGNSGG